MEKGKKIENWSESFGSSSWNCVIKKNKGGPSHLARATAQGLGLPEDDFKRRKNETNETIIYAWTFLKEKYKFPIKLYTETGSHLIDNQYELFKFLRSSESPKTFNLPVVELSSLAKGRLPNKNPFISGTRPNNILPPLPI